VSRNENPQHIYTFGLNNVNSLRILALLGLSMIIAGIMMAFIFLFERLHWIQVITLELLNNLSEGENYFLFMMMFILCIFIALIVILRIANWRHLQRKTLNSQGGLREV
jgi:hypothetical protein